MSANSHLNFRGKVRIIRESAKRVDGGMNDDAGEQAAAAIKDRDQQETDAGCSSELSVSHCNPLALPQHIDALPSEDSPHPLRRRKSEAPCSFGKWHEPHLPPVPARWGSRDFAGSTDRSVQMKT